MPPARELTELAERKAALRRRIATSRLHCAALAGEVARPLARIDRLVARWRRISPYLKMVGVPLSWWLWQRFRRRKTDLLSHVMRWAPAVFGLARKFAAGRTA
jgi:hypothetical protein